MIIPARAGNQAPVGRERDVVDLLLMSQHARHRLRPLVHRVPEVHGEVVAGRRQPLHHLALYPGRLLEPLPGQSSLPFFRLGHLLPVLEVRRPQHVVRRQREMVHPVRVRGQRVHQRASDRVPDLDRLVVAGRVDQPLGGPGAAPARSPLDAADAALVPAEDVLRPARVYDPQPHGAVLACGRQPRRAVPPEVVRLPRQAQHPLAVAPELASRSELARLRVPHPHRLVHAARRQPAAVRRPRHGQHPARVACQRAVGCARVRVPDAGRVVAGPGGQARGGGGREGGAEDGLPVARDAVRQARDGLHAEDGLRLGRERERCFEGGGYAVGGEERQQSGWICRVEV